MTIPVLSLLIFLPSLGALVMWAVRDSATAYKQVALWSGIATFALSVAILLGFDSSTPAFQLVEKIPWIGRFNIHYQLGIDGISLVLVLLTTLLSVISILASWNYIKKHEFAFFVSLLVLETGMLGVFLATDLFLFYLFWEVMLVPMYFIIGIWGGEKRVYAAIKFFLYTLVGSLLMLVAIVATAWQASKSGGISFDLATLQNLPKPVDFQFWAFGAFFLGFAIKVPMFPFHTWLPDAHTEAPTAGSVILAGVLLKMGAYGLLRFAIPLFPDAAVMLIPVIMVLSVIAILYAGFVTLVQRDFKRLIAYSSVSHMGFVTAGLFAFNLQGLQGSIVLMIAHGLLTGALFLLVGYLTERTHTRELSAMEGMATSLPLLGSFMLFFALGSLGLPGLAGFTGEFLSLVGIFTYSKIFGALATLGIVIAAAYLLWAYQRTFFGPALQTFRGIKDLSLREVTTLAPLAALSIFLGVYPAPMLDLVDASARAWLAHMAPALAQNSPSLLSFLGGF